MSFVRRAAALAAWPLALGSATAAILAHGGRTSAVLDVLTHPTPAYLMAALLAAGLAAAAGVRRHKALLFVSLAGILAAAALVAPELLERPDPRAPPGSPGQLKVVQFNTWTGNARPEAVAAWLLAQKADVIVLEEGAPVRGRLIAAGYRPACNGCSPVIYARAKPLARFPPAGVYDEDSGVTWATYADPRGAFTVVAVHGHWPTAIAEVEAQAAALREHLARLPKDRMILAGDFNSAPWSFARRRDDRDLGLIRRTRALFTWPAAAVSHNRLPAPFPYLPIDHVYAGPTWATVKVERGPRLGSDHYPVVVTLAPRASGGT